MSSFQRKSIQAAPPAPNRLTLQDANRRETPQVNASSRPIENPGLRPAFWRDKRTPSILVAPKQPSANTRETKKCSVRRWSDLPQDVHAEIFKHLGYRYAARISHSSREFNRLADEALPWVALLDGAQGESPPSKQSRASASACLNAAVVGCESRRIVHAMLGGKAPSLRDLLQSYELWKAQLADWKRAQRSLECKRDADQKINLFNSARRSGGLLLSVCSPSLTNLPECLYMLTSVEELDCSGCSSLDTLPKSLGKMTHLRTLRLNGCRRLAAVPKEVCQLSKLQRLDLRGCVGITQVPAGLGNLTQLPWLDLSGCRTLLMDPEIIKRLERLQFLSLRRCKTMRNMAWLNTLQRPGLNIDLPQF